LKRSPIPAEFFGIQAAQEVEPRRGEYGLANLNLKIASSALSSAYVIDACLAASLQAYIVMGFTRGYITNVQGQSNRVGRSTYTSLFGTNYNFLTVSLVLHFCRCSLGAFTSTCPFGFLLIPPMLGTVIKPITVI